MAFVCSASNPVNFLDECACNQEDVMLLYDALRECDPLFVTDILLSEVEEWKIPFSVLGEGVQLGLVKRVNSALKNISNLEVNLDLQTSKLIIPVQEFKQVDAGRSVRRKVKAGVVDTALLEKFASENYKSISMEACKLCADGAGCSANRSSCYCADLLMAEGILESASVLSAASIEEALSMRIWLPSELNAFDKYSVLSEVFWMLTWLDVADVSTLYVHESCCENIDILAIDEMHNLNKGKSEYIANYLNCTSLASAVNSVQRLGISA